MGHDVLFYLMAGVLIAAASGVIFIRNTVHAAFALVATFGTVAVFYLLLNADFIAMAQLLVYAGAVIIMLLFALMLTQRKETVLGGGVNDQRSFSAGMVATLFFVAFVRVLTTSPWATANHSVAVASGMALAPGGTPMVIGKQLFSTFLLPFEVVSILLLMALVGAIVLARKETDTVSRDAVVPLASDAALSLAAGDPPPTPRRDPQEVGR